MSIDIANITHVLYLSDGHEDGTGETAWVYGRIITTEDGTREWDLSDSVDCEILRDEDGRYEGCSMTAAEALAALAERFHFVSATLSDNARDEDAVAGESYIVTITEG